MGSIRPDKIVVEQRHHDTCSGGGRQVTDSPLTGLSVDPALHWFPEANGKGARRTHAQKKAAD